MKPSDVIAKPENWAQGYYAFNKNGAPVGAKCEAAIRFCILGAIEKVYGWSEWSGCDNIAKGHSVIKKLDNYLKLPLHKSIINWNDDPLRTHEEVLSALKAIGE